MEGVEIGDKQIKLIALKEFIFQWKKADNEQKKNNKYINIIIDKYINICLFNKNYYIIIIINILTVDNT